MQRYSALYHTFKMKTFTREQARDVIKQSGLNSDERLTNTFFSELVSRGWAKFDKDKEDKRKKIFKLISPEEAILNLDLNEEKE